MSNKNIVGKLRITLLAVSVTVLGFYSCSKKNTDTSATGQFTGTWNGSGCVTQAAKWTEMAPMLSTGRKGAVSFAINNIIYVGGGTTHKDFWSFDPDANHWTRLADIPGTRLYRGYGVGFSIGDKGYIGLGADNGLDSPVANFYEYDPTTNIWTDKASMPDVSRQGAFAFVQKGVAYVGGGYDSTGTWLKDFWAFSPGINTWTRKTDLPNYIYSPFAFASTRDVDSGFVSCGKQAYYEDTSTYMYRVSTNAWTRMAPYPGHVRQGGSCFVINNIAYCGLGKAYGVGNEFEDFYTYDMATNMWKILGAFPKGPDLFATAASANGKAYIGTGTDIYNHLYTYWMQYTPMSNTESFTISAGPNNYSLYMTCRIGLGDTCARDVSLLGTVSSNAMDNFSIGVQSFTDRCGKTWTINGGGTLGADNVLTITTVKTSSEGTSACIFKGRK